MRQGLPMEGVSVWGAGVCVEEGSLGEGQLRCRVSMWWWARLVGEGGDGWKHLLGGGSR